MFKSLPDLERRARALLTGYEDYAGGGLPGDLESGSFVAVRNVRGNIAGFRERLATILTDPGHGTLPQDVRDDLADLDVELSAADAEFEAALDPDLHWSALPRAAKGQLVQREKVRAEARDGLRDRLQMKKRKAKK